VIGLHTGTEQPVQRLVDEKLRRQRQRTLGKSQAVEDHTGHGFAGGDLFIGIRNEPIINPFYET
jgi:hypothetical protein